MPGASARRLWAAGPYLAAALIVCLKMPYLFSAEPIQGWDTIGHLHLATVYRGLFSELRSTGYDPSWFQGQPAFVLYPPFFYFVVALLDLALGRFVPLAASFNLTILLVVLFYCCAWVSFARLFLDGSSGSEPGAAAETSPSAGDLATRALLLLAGLLVPLSYPGDGLQGAGLVGVLGGTFVSTLGLALALAALAALERHRRERRRPSLVGYFAAAGLLFYTHYLSTIFFYLLLALYLAAFRRDFRGLWAPALALAPAALGAPIIGLYAGHSAFSSATAQATYYPPLLSLLGKDFYAAWRAAPSLPTLVQLLVAHLKITQVLAVGLSAAGVALVIGGRLRTRQARFVCAAALLFLWLALDTSPALLLSGLPVHWYRAFDFFLALFGLLAVLGLGWTARRFAGRLPEPALPAALATLLILRFAAWDPVAHEEYRDTSLTRSLRSDADATRLAAALASLPRGSLILPEVLRSRGLHGSPHWLDHLIQSAGHRNALGLTIESSLTPLVTYAYLAQGMGQVFVWGIDASWAQAIFAGLEPAAAQRLSALPAYLAAAGVEYVITQSETARAYAGGMPRAFVRVFGSGPYGLYRVEGALPEVTALGDPPWGLVDLAALRGERMPARRLYREFLLHANWVRISAGIDPIINLSPKTGLIAGLRDRIAGLIIVNAGAEPAAYHSLPLHIRSGLPLILVNFVDDPSLPADVRVLRLPAAGGAEANAAAFPGPARGPLRLAYTESAVTGSSVRADGELVPLAAAAGATAAHDVRAIEVRLSYSPQWRGSERDEVFQTGLNHMLVLAPGAHTSADLDLRLESPLSRVVTLVMALLVVAGAAAGWLSFRPRRPPLQGRRSVFTALTSRVGPPGKGKGDPGISDSAPPRVTS